MDGFLPLPCGVTGFAPATIKTTGVNAQDFRRACWDVAIDLGGQITAFDADKLATSRYRADLILSNAALRVLCNRRHPVIALVPQEGMPSP